MTAHSAPAAGRSQLVGIRRIDRIDMGESSHVAEAEATAVASFIAFERSGRIYGV
jgi:hypothetical protein